MSLGIVPREAAEIRGEVLKIILKGAEAGAAGIVRREAEALEEGADIHGEVQVNTFLFLFDTSFNNIVFKRRLLCQIGKVSMHGEGIVFFHDFMLPWPIKSWNLYDAC